MSAPHEGIDMCLYRGRCGGVIRFDGEIRIPAIGAGMMVRIIRDYPDLFYSIDWTGKPSTTRRSQR
ncbi:hypothetical protein ACFLZM_00990 [Thermodesulfobacteriota bacterium]